MKSQMGVMSAVPDMETYVTAQLTPEERYEIRVPAEEFINHCSFAGKSCPARLVV